MLQKLQDCKMKASTYWSEKGIAVFAILHLRRAL
jgi:hypothetical protein